MSRAFIKETDDTPVVLPDRPLSEHPNWVTPAGRAAIENAVHRFEAAHRAALDKGDVHAAASDIRELRYWRARLSSAQVIYPAATRDHVSFGGQVTIRRRDGREQTFRIVGEDEAEPSNGTVSHVSPLARAVLGRETGETIEFSGQEAVIISIF